MPNFNQPVCNDCWDSENPDRPSVRMAAHGREVETCCMCGAETVSGIYVRRDPASTYFPAS